MRTLLNRLLGLTRHAAALEGSVLALCILDLVKGGRGWCGTVSELLQEIPERAFTFTDDRQAIPRQANRLSSELRRITPLLRGRGVEVVRERAGKDVSDGVDALGAAAQGRGLQRSGDGGRIGRRRQGVAEAVSRTEERNGKRSRDRVGRTIIPDDAPPSAGKRTGPDLHISIKARGA